MNRRELLALFGLGAATVIAPAPFLDALTRKSDLAAVADLPMAELRHVYVFGCGRYSSVGSVVVRDERRTLLHWQACTTSAFMWVPRPEERLYARAFAVEADLDLVAVAHFRRGDKHYVISSDRKGELLTHG